TIYNVTGKPVLVVEHSTWIVEILLVDRLEGLQIVPEGFLEVLEFSRHLQEEVIVDIQPLGPLFVLFIFPDRELPESHVLRFCCCCLVYLEIQQKVSRYTLIIFSNDGWYPASSAHTLL
ncbi:hypothetical protein, partial [Salmonella enterica]|uniref:hypothetical protein n=1 Tax=Salmonella enterica TaxID=28901 RepID=UPI0035231A68